MVISQAVGNCHTIWQVKVKIQGQIRCTATSSSRLPNSNSSVVMLWYLHPTHMPTRTNFGMKCDAGQIQDGGMAEVCVLWVLSSFSASRYCDRPCLFVGSFVISFGSVVAAARRLAKVPPSNFYTDFRNSFTGTISEKNCNACSRGLIVLRISPHAPQTRRYTTLWNTNVKTLAKMINQLKFSHYLVGSLNITLLQISLRNDFEKRSIFW